MMKSLFLYMGILSLLASLLVCVRPEPAQEYHVIPDATECPPDLTPCQNVSSLVQFTMVDGVPPNSAFRFLPGIHTLDQDWRVDNVSSLTLELENFTTDVQSGAVLVCGEYGLYYEQIAIYIAGSRAVVIDGLTLVNCSVYVSDVLSVTVANLNVNFGTVVLDSCANINVSCSSFEASQFAGLEVSFFETILDTHTYTKAVTRIHQTNFSSSFIGLYILVFGQGGIVNSIEFELSDIVAKDNIYYNIYLYMDCIGTVDIMRLESVGSDEALLIRNDDQCNDNIGVLKISDSLFKGSRSYGISAIIQQSGHVELNSITVQDIGTNLSAAVGVIFWQTKKFLLQNILERTLPYTQVILRNITVQRVHGSNLNLQKYARAAIVMIGIPFAEATDLVLQDNIGSGLLLHGSHITLTGMLTLRNNTAFNGGGLFLQFRSKIWARSPLSIEFDSNMAAQFGGGIYISSEPESLLDFVLENI